MKNCRYCNKTLPKGKPTFCNKTCYSEWQKKREFPFMGFSDEYLYAFGINARD